LLLAAICMLAALAAAWPAGSAATTTPKRCGTIKANGKTFAVRGHLTKCKFARRTSKRYLRDGTEPHSWSCIRYPRRVTSIAFICRRGIKDVYAIRR
jgi:hypothetical protein